MKIPEQFTGRVDYGLYGGIVQFFIVGVDGTLAQLGKTLPDHEKLERWISNATREHDKLVAKHDRRRAHE